jgi:glycosyltransferase involved in cell wall biosynthesis
MQHRPILTLIVACYNVAPFLEECLQSILDQTYPHFQVLAFNDGSTDSTPDIINKFAHKDSRIIPIHQKNKGISSVRNKGIEMTNTPFLAFIDGDDFLDVNYLNSLVFENGNYDLTLCSYNRVFSSFNRIRRLGWSGSYSASLLQRRIIGLVFKELSNPDTLDNFSTVWAKVYKTNIIKKFNIVFENLDNIGTSEDTLFNIHYLNHVQNVLVIDKPLYQYRKNNFLSITTSYKSRLVEQWEVLFGLIEPFIKNKSKDYKIAFHNRLALSILGLGLNEINNPEGFSIQYTNLNLLLHKPIYREAFQQFQWRFLPLHWRLFFIFARFRFVFGLLLMLKGMQWMIKKNQ